jgi:predicted RNase H-like nuclease (RuvC/YqgF family)
MLLQILVLWGCVPEITRDCVDMTNTSSTYLSIALGAIVGGVISWFIYNMQKKTSVKQDETLRRISELEESHDKVLKTIQQFQKHHEKLLSQILNLDKKIDAMIEKEDRRG